MQTILSVRCLLGVSNTANILWIIAHKADFGIFRNIRNESIENRLRSTSIFPTFLWITRSFVSAYLINANPKQHQHQTISSNENKLKKTTATAAAEAKPLIEQYPIKIKCDLKSVSFFSFSLSFEFMLEFISIHCANAHIHMSVIMILGIGFHCKRYTATQIQHSVLNPYLCPPTTARTLIKYVFSTNVSKPILRWNFQAENLRNSHYGIVIDTHIHNNDDDFKKNRTLSRTDLFRADFFFAFIKFFYLENFRDLIYSLQAFAIFLINLCLSLWVRLWWFTFFSKHSLKCLIYSFWEINEDFCFSYRQIFGTHAHPHTSECIFYVKVHNWNGHAESIFLISKQLKLFVARSVFWINFNDRYKTPAQKQMHQTNMQTHFHSRIVCCLLPWRSNPCMQIRKKNKKSGMRKAKEEANQGIRKSRCQTKRNRKHFLHRNEVISKFIYIWIRYAKRNIFLPLISRRFSSCRTHWKSGGTHSKLTYYSNE